MRPSKTRATRVKTTAKPLKQIALKEAALFLVLLFFGFVLMPIGIYLVGQNIFGDYGGYGYADFFGILSGKIRAGELVAWFLILAPYLAWQTARMTVFGWQWTSRTRG